jgi:hypothetical protein
MPVPKTAMHEDDAAKPRKNKVWTAGQILAVETEAET